MKIKITLLVLLFLLSNWHFLEACGEVFSKNYDSVINGRKVIDWIKQGSTDEDSPPCRASNHFHNPLLPWNESYMSDEPWWMSLKCSSWSPWYSDITWATGVTSKYGIATARNNQTMGWDNARTYFYNALTSESKTTREDYFAKTFQTVGYVMEINSGGINL